MGLTCLGGFEVEPTNWPDTAGTANMPDKGGPALNGQRPEVEDKGEEPGRWYLHELIHYDDFSSKVRIWLGGLHCEWETSGRCEWWGDGPVNCGKDVEGTLHCYGYRVLVTNF